MKRLPPFAPSAFARATAVAAGVVALLLASSLVLAQERLVYEREFAMISGADNTLRIVVTADGDVTIDRPAFMTHAGEHRGNLPESAWTELRLAIESIDFSSRALDQDVRQRSRNELFVVSDPEYSRFGMFDDSRAPLKVIEVESLKAYAQRFDDRRLKQLRDLERRLIELMDQVIEGSAS